MARIEIEIPHFYQLEYKEDEKKMIVDIDFRDPIMYLGIDLINHWEHPYDQDFISQEKKLEILRNIREFLISKGFSKSRIEYFED